MVFGCFMEVYGCWMIFDVFFKTTIFDDSGNLIDISWIFDTVDSLVYYWIYMVMLETLLLGLYGGWMQVF